MGELIHLDAQRPHALLRVVCQWCGARWIGVVDCRSDFSKLECHRCGARETVYEHHTEE